MPNVMIPREVRVVYYWGDALRQRSGRCKPGALPAWAAEDRFAARLTAASGALATR